MNLLSRIEQTKHAPGNPALKDCTEPGHLELFATSLENTRFNGIGEPLPKNPLRSLTCIAARTYGDSYVHSPDRSFDSRWNSNLNQMIGRESVVAIK